MFNLDDLAGILRARGLKVVETPGWNTRGYAGQDLAAAGGVLWHHTATPSARYPSSGNMPTLNMLINGHSSLPGPLCNIGFGRDGTVYLVATGVANHAGTGSLPGIPTNMGNHYLIGIEMESSGVAPWDWTPEQLEEAPKLGAALELAYMQDRPATQRIQAAHYEYSDAGKIDPAGWPGGMDGLRSSINNQIAQWSTGTQSDTITPIKQDTEGFLMALSDADQLEVRDNMRKIVGWINTIKNNTDHINTTSGAVSLRQMVADATRASQTAAANTAPILRGGQQVSLRQEVADIKSSTQRTEPVLVDIAKTVKADDVDNT